MGGLLTHLSVALVGFLIGTFIFKNYKYGLAFIFGQLIPDLIDFGTLIVATRSFDYHKLMLHPWFRPLAELGHTWWHWTVLVLVLFLIVIILYKLKKISKKTFKTLCFILVFFLVSVETHLILDSLIIETHWWL